MIGRVKATVEVKALPEDVFAAMVDLPSQDEWMLGTRLFALSGEDVAEGVDRKEVRVPQVGSKIAALTGIAGMGVLDTMTVTVFDPPHRWEVRHTGSAFKGVGIFRVEPTPTGSRVTWVEEIDLPFGILGGLGFRLVKPLVHSGLAISLRHLARGVCTGILPVTQRPTPIPGQETSP